MRSLRIDVARLALDGTDLPLAYGDVLVVDKEGNEGLEWELQVVTIDDHDLQPAAVDLELVLLDGRRAAGNAFLVRTRERMAVFRGIGDLAGVSGHELR